MAYRVIKPLPQADGSSIATGTLVDASNWLNVRALVNTRYLVEVLGATVDAIAVDQLPQTIKSATVTEVIKKKAVI